jgi:hypothetical protein
VTGMEQLHIDRRESDRRAKLNEPVTLKVFAGVLVTVIASAFLWLSAVAGSSVVTSQRFTTDSARRDFRDSMRARDMQEVRDNIRCVRAMVAKSPNVGEVCR